MTRFEIVNEEDIPENLPPGEYQTRVVEAGFKDGDCLIKLEFLGGIEDRNNRTCLFPLTKHSLITESELVHPFVD